MEFRDWLMSKFLEWEQTMPRRQSYSAFARHLGVKQSTFSQWINGNNTPDYEKVKTLSVKLGNEVYSVLGYKIPDPFPLSFRDALESARVKIIETGVSGDSPEAESIIISAMNAAGYKLIPINDDESVKSNKAAPFK